MKVSKLAIIVVLGVISYGATAATGNNGKVTFNGEVVDSPCNLAPGQDGMDVKVPFGQLSLSQLNANVVTAKKFQIHLENCNLTGKTADITFASTDLISGKNLLTTHGEATGLGIAISGITFGTAKPIIGMNPTGDNILTYTAEAKKANTATNVTVGNFEATTNFVIAYK